MEPMKPTDETDVPDVTADPTKEKALGAGATPQAAAPEAPPDIVVDN